MTESESIFYHFSKTHGGNAVGLMHLFIRKRNIESRTWNGSRSPFRDSEMHFYRVNLENILNWVKIKIFLFRFSKSNLMISLNCKKRHCKPPGALVPPSMYCDISRLAKWKHFQRESKKKRKMLWADIKDHQRNWGLEWNNILKIANYHFKVKHFKICHALENSIFIQ